MGAGARLIANVTCLVTVAVVSLPWDVPTAEAQARDRAAARALFQEGIECVDREDWECAVDRFARAHELRASPVIASNLGHALIHVGRLVEGIEMLQEVQRSAEAPAALRTDAETTIAELAPQLGRLTLRLTGPLAGAELSMDGRPFPDSLVAVASPSDPGDHRIEVRRGGEVVASTTAHVEPGAAIEVDLAIPALPEIEETIATHEETDAEARVEGSLLPPPRGAEVYEEAWFWALIGGVVVATAAGITIGVLVAPGAQLPGGSLGTIDIR
jgi:hypothetical protein